MSTESDIAVILPIVAATKTMVASLYALLAQQNAASAVATPVDFIVDLFDRGDADGLGSYWSGASPWVIRSGYALPRGTTYVAGLSQMGAIGPASFGANGALGPTIATSQTADQSMCSVGAINNNRLLMSSLKAKVANLYLASLTSGSMTCKIQFTVATQFNEVDTTALGTNGVDVISNKSVRTLLASVGAAFGNDAGNIAGAHLAYTLLPQVVTASATTGFGISTVDGSHITASLGPLALASALLSTGDFGDSVSVSSPFPFCEGNGPVTVPNVATAPGPGGVVMTMTQNTTQQFAPGGTASPMAVGENTLLMTVANGAYTISINGTIVFSGASALLAAPDRAGLCAYAVDVLAQVLQFGVGLGGITSFKAWRSDQPEPPNQSGHGTLVNGQRVYSDKYHLPIIANNVITGYTYNPNA